MFSIQQANDHDCGFTALKILLANIHHDENYLFLPSPFFKESVSFFALMEIAETYNVSLTALKAIDKEEIIHNDKFPFIARIKKEENYHALYVYKMNKKYLYYIDPSSGTQKIKIEQFISLWTGEMLAIKEFNKTKCPIKKPKYLKNKELIISILFEFVSALSALLAVYFIHKDSYIFLPVIFFSLMLISEILLKRYSLLLLKRIDKRVEDNIFDIKDKDYYAYYFNYEQYKKYLLVNNISLFSSF
ncbi:MAG: hypothetical protein K5906_02190, partial [Bacilli bacterium]|nr:hypothetical protein [Bacilli bacterium]